MARTNTSKPKWEQTEFPFAEQYRKPAVQAAVEFAGSFTLQFDPARPKDDRTTIQFCCDTCRREIEHP